KAVWASYCPYYAYMGVELEHLAAGSCTVRLKAQPDIGNSKGDIHGGAIAGLLDIVSSQAVRSAYNETVTVATINLTVNYLAKAYGDISAVARVLRAGKTVAYVEADVLNTEGEVVGRASATYRINLKR